MEDYVMSNSCVEQKRKKKKAFFNKKDIEIKNAKDLTEVQVFFVILLLNIEAEKRNMAFHAEEDVKKTIMSGDAVCAVYKGRVCGFATLLPWQKYMEASCLVVDPVFRQYEIATDVINALIEHFTDKYGCNKKLIAFANDISCKIFAKSNFVGYPKNYFDPEVRSECVDCDEEDLFPRCRCKGMIYCDVDIKQFDIEDRDIIDGVATLYCDVWSESPWHEVWDKQEVISNIESIFLDWRTSQAYALIIDGVVCGFAWGQYLMESDMRKISSGADVSELFPYEENAFYINELAVDKKYRKKGFGKDLINELIGWIERALICLRTDQDAHAAKVLYKSLGFEETNIVDKKHTSRVYWKHEV